MAANLYARSIFGEDALANVSIEVPVDQGPDAAVTGHIRIRAKSQVCGLRFSVGGAFKYSFFLVDQSERFQFAIGMSLSEMA